jgi:hypothetical protein
MSFGMAPGARRQRPVTLRVSGRHHHGLEITVYATAGCRETIMSLSRNTLTKRQESNLKSRERRRPRLHLDSETTERRECCRDGTLNRNYHRSFFVRVFRLNDMIVSRHPAVAYTAGVRSSPSQGGGGAFVVPYFLDSIPAWVYGEGISWESPRAS